MLLVSVWPRSLILAACLLLFPATPAKECNSATPEETISKFDDLLNDMHDTPGAEARYVAYDRLAAFNSSIDITIPVISFRYPGAFDTTTTNSHIDGNISSALAFISIFLVGGLAVAIFTFNVVPAENERRNFDNMNFMDNFINEMMWLVQDTISELPAKLGGENCAYLAVCSAHAEPDRNRKLGEALRFIFPDKEEGDYELKFTNAAKIGKQGSNSCYYEFPCFFQPLDILQTAVTEITNVIGKLR